MGKSTDRNLALVITATAIVFVATLASREIRAYRDGGPISREPEPPEFIEDWRRIAASGTPIGDIGAEVVIVEFGDFECPYCQRFATLWEDLRRRHGKAVSLVYQHFPLTNLHRFAMPAAIASECAHAQGRFPEMYHVLYEKQDSLGLKSWAAYAAEAGVPDGSAFKRCVEDERSSAKMMEKGREIARRLGITATPTLMINGWLFRDGLTTDEIGRRVQDLLDRDVP